MIADVLKEIKSPYFKENEAAIKYRLIYDTPGGGLEPLYFWLLNFVGGAEKIIDTFASSEAFDATFPNSLVQSAKPSDIPSNLPTNLSRFLPN